MSLFNGWLIFLIIIFTPTFLPRAHTLLCFVNAVHYGGWAGIYTALGNITIATLVIVFSFFMASFIFESLKYVIIITTCLGVCYALYIGVTSWLITESDFEFVSIGDHDRISNDINSDNEDMLLYEDSQDGDNHTQPILKHYLSGVFISLSSVIDMFLFILLGGIWHAITNPWINNVLNNLVFTPNTEDDSIKLTTLLFSTTFIILRLLLSLLYVWLGVKSSSFIMQPKRVTVFNRIIGSIFFGIAIMSIIFLMEVL